jgi:ribosomal protein S18 acetylase RimI-like enzyme
VTANTRVAIRDATTADTEEIATLHLVSWGSAYRDIVPDGFLESITLESRITRWRRALSKLESPSTETAVAVSAGAILGVCSSGPRREPASTDAGEIYALHIGPESRRRGLGRMLLDDALQRFSTRGLSSAVLWVLRDNAGARRFYEAQGWSFTGEDQVEDRSGFAIPEVRYAITIAKAEVTLANP